MSGATSPAVLSVVLIVAFVALAWLLRRRGGSFT